MSAGGVDVRVTVRGVSGVVAVVVVVPVVCVTGMSGRVFTVVPARVFCITAGVVVGDMTAGVIVAMADVIEVIPVLVDPIDPDDVIVLAPTDPEEPVDPEELPEPDDAVEVDPDDPFDPVDAEVVPEDVLPSEDPEPEDPEPAVVSPPDVPADPSPEPDVPVPSVSEDPLLLDDPEPDDAVVLFSDVEDVVAPVPDELLGVTVTAFTLDAVSEGVAFLGGVGGAPPETKDICPLTILTCVFVGSAGLNWYPLPSTNMVDVMLLAKETIMLEPLMPATALGVWTSNLFPSVNWATFWTKVFPDITCTWPVASLMMLFVFFASDE